MTSPPGRPAVSALPYFAFVGCSLIWGSTFLFIAESNEVMPPMWAITLRLILGGTALGVIMLLTRTPVPRGAALKAAVGYGVFDFGISFPLLYYGETILPSGLTAVLYGSAPIVSILIGRLFGVETLDPRKMLAAAASIGGIALIFWREIAFGVPPLAILAVIGAVVTAVTSSMFLKRGPQQSAIGANAVGSLVSVPIVLTLSVIAGERRSIPSSAAEWFPLLYLVVAGSLGAFVMFAWLIKHWKVSSASFIAVIVPIVAVSLGALVRNERLAPGTAAGAAVVILATVWALRAEARG